MVGVAMVAWSGHHGVCGSPPSTAQARQGSPDSVTISIIAVRTDEGDGCYRYLEAA